MSSQIQITGETKVKSLTGVLVGTSGVVSSLNIDGSLGIPQLDVNGKILVSQLPNSVMEYKGTWDASTNTPTLVNGTGNQGDVYLCSVAGTVNFGAGAISFVVSDQVIYSGSIWQKASGTSGTVTSVAASITGNSLGITGSPITTAGTLAFAFAGTNLQYVNGAGNLTTFPTLTGYVPYTGATQDVDLGAFKLNAQSLHAKGTAGNGHLGLKHQSASATASANEVSLFADSLGDLSWLNGNLYLSKFITSGNTANRTYTFPNANGTVALTSDISYPVTSVFGRTGAVVATSGDYTTTLVTEGTNLYYTQARFDTAFGLKSTTNLTEGTNLYYTDVRARASNSFVAGSGAYNSTTGVITIPTNNNQITNGAGYITSSALTGYIPYTGTGITVFGLSAIGEYDGGAQIPAGYGGNYALTLGNGLIGNGLSLYTSGSINAGSITTAGFSRVTNATASTSTITGAFVVTGGVGIGGALYGTSIILSGTIGNGTYTYTLPSATGTLPVGTGTSGYVTYFSGTNTIAGAVNHFWDDTNSRLGINTSTPLSPLQVVIGAGSGTVARFGEASGTTGKQLLIGVDTATGRSELQSVHQGTGATPLALNPSSGNVLIGTTANSIYTLDVSGTGRFTGNAYFGTASSGVGVVLVNSTTSVFSVANRGVLEVNGASTSIMALTISGTDGGYLYHNGTDLSVWNSKNGVLKFGTNNTIKATIDAAGNVGIGTNLPSYPLEVIGAGSFTSSGSSVLYLKNTAGSGNRNWRIVTNNAAAGDITFDQSTTDQGSSYATKLVVTSGGNVGIGNTGNSIIRLLVQGVDTTSSNYAANFQDSGTYTLFSVRNDGFFVTGTRASSPHNFTSGAAANCVIDTDGALRRSISSLKYKTDVRDYDKGLNEVIQMRAVYYKGKNDGDTQFAGLIAEEVHDLGLTEFVQYAEDGTPDALAYSNMIALLTKAIQELSKQNEELSNRLIKLENK